MNKPNIAAIYFSPTGTTESVINHIASGMGQDQPLRIDLTDKEKREAFFAGPDSLPGDAECVLVGMPVYFGYIPQFLKEKIQSINGKGMAAVAVVVYGNRDFDYALKELRWLLERSNFRVVGAAAFIGEHSFSSCLPIAMDRPDREDLIDARRFGEQLSAGLNKITPIAEEDVPGKKMKQNPEKPVKLLTPPHPRFIQSQCNQCGLCAEHCPMGIISSETFDYRDNTAQNLCLGCMSCVKKCSEGARVLEFPPIMKVLLKRLVLRNAMKQRRAPVFVLK